MGVSTSENLQFLVTFHYILFSDIHFIAAFNLDYRLQYTDFRNKL
jgi:hypothetical protein